MAIILVQSEKTASGEFDHYQDETGKRYSSSIKPSDKSNSFLSAITSLPKKEVKRKIIKRKFSFNNFKYIYFIRTNMILIMLKIIINLSKSYKFQK